MVMISGEDFGGSFVSPLSWEDLFNISGYVKGGGFMSPLSREEIFNIMGCTLDQKCDLDASKQLSYTELIELFISTSSLNLLPRISLIFNGNISMKLLDGCMIL